MNFLIFDDRKWKKDVAQRAKAKAAAPRRKPVETFDLLDLVDMDFTRWVVPDDEDDGDYEEIEEPEPTAQRQPRQRGRRSRMAWHQAAHS